MSPSLTLSDSKDAYLLSATVTIVGRPLDAGSEFLDATTTGTSITASYNPGWRTWRSAASIRWQTTNTCCKA